LAIPVPDKAVAKIGGGGIEKSSKPSMLIQDERKREKGEKKDLFYL
jgi:hypothetical protein